MNATKQVDAVQKESPRELIQRLETGQLTEQERIRILQRLETESPDDTAVLAALVKQSFTGPLPPPHLLAQYDRDTRRVILDMARNEQEHTHAMQRQGLEGTVLKDRRGQWIGGTIAVTGLVVAAVIAPHSAVAAGLIGTLDLFGMVALFVAPRILEYRGKTRQVEE